MQRMPPPSGDRSCPCNFISMALSSQRQGSAQGPDRTAMDDLCMSLLKGRGACIEKLLCRHTNSSIGSF
jgi:hypothetical protein